MKRNRNEKINKKNNIFENHIIENLKKYYNIDDHTDLLKYIKKTDYNQSLKCQWFIMNEEIKKRLFP